MHGVHHHKLKNVKTVPLEDQRAFIPYGRQWIDEEDIQAVVEVLRSERLTQGTKVTEFEAAFADYVGSRYAIAVSNGTAALHLACLAAGLGPGDEVITSPITFVASANCTLYVGAKPVFVDIDSGTCNLDPLKLEAYLEEKLSGSETDRGSAAGQPKAIIPVHFAGLPCDMSAIDRIARKYNLIVIEDACHALGAEYKGSRPEAGGPGTGKDEWFKVGGCDHSRMAVFSFHPVKHITTGEGGMVTTNDKKLYDRLLLLRSHGITRDRDQFANLKKPENSSTPPLWYYEMKQLGFNYRITDIQCALGLSQLKKADVFMDVRRQIAQRYRQELSACSAIQLLKEPKGFRSANHLFPVKIDFERTGRDRQGVMQYLGALGIGTQVHYIPIPRQPYYQHLGFRSEDYPEAEKFYRQCLSLPIFPGLKMYEVERVFRSVETLFSS